VAVGIVRYRAERQLTQRSLAERLRLLQPEVAEMERGDVSPKRDALERLASRRGIGFTTDEPPS
jgi:transcriptional regulator with XRE-family HTH domain